MKVLIGIEHELMRYGFIQLLNDLKQIEYTVLKSTKEDAYRAARKYPFDLIVLHADMEGAVSDDTIFSAADLQALKLLITGNEQTYRSMAADAVLPDTLSLDEWTRSLNKLFHGEKLQAEIEAGASSEEILTKRQEEVFRLKIQGYSVRESAAYLHISPKTIENHRRNIAIKLDLTSNKAWIDIGKKLGFF